jgi:hypothetical protein
MKQNLSFVRPTAPLTNTLHLTQRVQATAEPLDTSAPRCEARRGWRKPQLTPGAYPGLVSGAALDLVVRYRKGQTYGVHTLLAALEVEPPSAPYDLHLARSADEVAERVREGVVAGRRVLTVWSFYSPDAAAMAEELAEVRALAPGDGAVHLAGGVHATAEPLVTLRAGWDAVAIGEGERTFTRFVQVVASGAAWQGIPGTAYLDANGELERNDCRSTTSPRSRRSEI